MYVYHSFHPNIWTLLCFCILAIVSSAAMDVGVLVSFQISALVFLDLYLGNGIPGSYGCYVFSFFETPPYCIPQWLHQCTSPPIVYEGSLFSTSLPVCVLFDDAGYEMTSHCGFDWCFCWVFFVCTCCVS